MLETDGGDFRVLQFLNEMSSLSQEKKMFFKNRKWKQKYAFLKIKQNQHVQFFLSIECINIYL